MTANYPQFNSGLPSSDESERIILGSILLDNAALLEVAEHLRPTDFYHPTYRRVYAAMLDLSERLQPIDPILIAEELKKEGSIESIGGITIITNLAYGLPHFPNLTQYIDLVKEMAIRRELIRVCGRIMQEAAEGEAALLEFADRAEQLVFEATRIHSSVSPPDLAQLVDESVASMGRGKLYAIPTGLADLDHVITGLGPGNLVIVAARPSMGKTALAVQGGAHAAHLGRRALICSIEMTAGEITDRLIASQARVNLADFRNGTLLRNSLEKVWAAAEHIKNLPLIIDAPPTLTIQQLRALTRRAIARHGGLDLLIVDHIQLMHSDRMHKDRRMEIEEISGGLKILAKEFNLPVIALSQLSRASEVRKPPRPMLSDLRESGSIEQDADVVLLLYRPSYYDKSSDDPSAEIIVAKNRNGPTGIVNVIFQGAYARFDNLAKEAGA